MHLTLRLDISASTFQFGCQWKTLRKMVDFFTLHKGTIWHPNWKVQGCIYLDVSKNRGTPKWMVYNVHNEKWMIWGYPYFRKHPFGYLWYGGCTVHNDFQNSAVSGARQEANHQFLRCCFQQCEAVETHWAQNGKVSNSDLPSTGYRLDVYIYI